MTPALTRGRRSFRAKSRRNRGRRAPIPEVTCTSPRLPKRSKGVGNGNLAVVPSSGSVEDFLPGRPGSGGIIIARADATPLHIREELAHARQATTSMRRDMVAVNEVIAAGDWRDRSARDRLNVFRKKLEIEVNAHEGLLAAATSTPAERAHAADTLSELQRLSAEVDGFTDLDIDDMNAGLRPLPQYLESPAWLASKVKSRERHLDLASNTHPTAMVVLPKAGPERSAAYNTRDGVSEIRRIGYEWDEMTYVNADHGGRVSFMREAEGPVAIITDARGVAHRYVLEPDGRRQASDGDVVEPGTVLATEPRRGTSSTRSSRPRASSAPSGSSIGAAAAASTTW